MSTVGAALESGRIDVLCAAMHESAFDPEPKWRHAYQRPLIGA